MCRESMCVSTSYKRLGFLPTTSTTVVPYFLLVQYMLVHDHAPHAFGRAGRAERARPPAGRTEREIRPHTPIRQAAT